jgi:hypothetical protein
VSAFARFPARLQDATASRLGWQLAPGGSAPRRGGVIYLAPIKALINNQEERLGIYAEMVGLRRFVRERWPETIPAGAHRRSSESKVRALKTALAVSGAEPERGDDEAQGSRDSRQLRKFCAKF